MSSSFVEVRSTSAVAPAPQSFLGRLKGKSVSGAPLVSNLNFTLNQGDWVTLYGGPGAGKTSVLRLLAGKIVPSQGAVLVNGRSASQQKNLAAGYVSASESEPGTRSTTQELQARLKQAAKTDSPLILLDDVADQLGPTELRRLLFQLFPNRTVVVTTRFPTTAEALNLPVLLLHRGTLACTGTCEEMAHRVAAPRTLNAWIEGIRYDIFREIKKHPGVADVRLNVDGRYQGQRLTITVKSSHYLPALYDLVSRVPVVQLEEVPVRLEDILKRL